MNWLREMRYAVRALARDKAFTVTVLVTLAVCIAANAATFAIVHSVLLRPLPVPESDAILQMSNRYPNAGVPVFNWSSAPDYYDRRRDVTVFEEQAMFSFRGQTLELNGIPERITSMAATPSLFRLLRVAPALGRAFTDEEGEIGAEQKVILSHGLWQQLYAGDSGALGSELRLSGRPFTVVGVMPRDFLFMDPDVRACGCRWRSPRSRNNSAIATTGTTSAASSPAPRSRKPRRRWMQSMRPTWTASRNLKKS